MRGILDGYLPLEKGGFKSNPHAHGDGGDSLIDVKEVSFAVVKKFQISSLAPEPHPETLSQETEESQWDEILPAHPHQLIHSKPRQSPAPPEDYE